MQKQVIFQIRLLAKTSLTYVTFKGPSASMNISMRFEITWGRKGFGTHCALMRLFLQELEGGGMKRRTVRLYGINLP